MRSDGWFWASEKNTFIKQDWILLKNTKNTGFVFKQALVIIKDNRAKTNYSEIIQLVTAQSCFNATYSQTAANLFVLIGTRITLTFPSTEQNAPLNQRQHLHPHSILIRAQFGFLCLGNQCIAEQGNCRNKWDVALFQLIKTWFKVTFRWHYKLSDQQCTFLYDRKKIVRDVFFPFLR